MTDRSPVESREQPSDDALKAALLKARTWADICRAHEDRATADLEAVVSELAERDATIRELRAELAEHDKRWQGRADLITQTGDLRRRAAELEEQIDEMTHRWGRLVAAEQDRASDALAERDRARDLAAHLPAQLEQLAARWDHDRLSMPIEGPINVSMRIVLRDCASDLSALAAHLEAEQAERGE